MTDTDTSGGLAVAWNKPQTVTSGFKAPCNGWLTAEYAAPAAYGVAYLYISTEKISSSNAKNTVYQFSGNNNSGSYNTVTMAVLSHAGYINKGDIISYSFPYQGGGGKREVIFYPCQFL